MDKNSSIIEGKIVAFEKLPNEIEDKVTLEFIIPKEWEDEWLEKFQDNTLVVFGKPNLDI